MFECLAGNGLVKEYLTRVLGKRSFGNSLLFGGPEGIGKSLFAKEFASEVLCLDDHNDVQKRKLQSGSHPDLRIYKPEGKIGMHSIESMRQFSTEVYMPPMEAKRKVFIILDAERMLPYSSNALLKTFEEPSLDSLIILVSSRPSALLPTILSRCRKVYFHELAEQEIVGILAREGVSPDKACSIAAVAQGSAGQAMRLLQPEFSARREKIIKALDRGRFDDYTGLSRFAQELAQEIEVSNDQWGAAMRDELKSAFSDKPTAQQQQAIDKEIDGVVAMKERSEAAAIFEIALSWYRDLEVLSAGAGKELLVNKEYADELIQHRQRGAFSCLQSAFTAIRDVQTLQERSTGLAICLENFFLRLNML